MNSSNSPVLFGCRTGICGTCLVEVNCDENSLEAAGAAEREILEVFAPGNKKARLACQLTILEDMEFTYIGK